MFPPNKKILCETLVTILYLSLNVKTQQIYTVTFTSFSNFQELYVGEVTLKLIINYNILIMKNSTCKLKCYDLIHIVPEIPE